MKKYRICLAALIKTIISSRGRAALGGNRTTIHSIPLVQSPIEKDDSMGVLSRHFSVAPLSRSICTVSKADLQTGIDEKR